MTTLNDNDHSDELIQKEKLVGNEVTLILEKNFMKPSDLEIELRDEIRQIDIKCETLRVDRDFPESFRGKNVFIKADTIEVRTKAKINLSGRDGVNNFNDDMLCGEKRFRMYGQDGNSGENGGNIYIEREDMINPTFLTIESNGGNGSNGENGRSGDKGADGRNASKADFTWGNIPITLSTIDEIVNDLKYLDSVNFFENGLQKNIIFDAENQELLMLVKGSRGEKGKPGSFGGYGGRGGKPGEMKQKGIKFIGRVGQDGSNGNNGFVGANGRDGGDAYMIIKSGKTQPTYGGLEKQQKFQLLSSEKKEKEDSIYDTKSSKYYFVLEITENFNAEETISTREITNIKNCKIEFCDALVSVLKNSNQLFYKVKRELQIKKFLNNEIDMDKFYKNIKLHSFDIPEYDILKYYAETQLIDEGNFGYKIKKTLKEYINPEENILKENKHLVIKGKILTSDIFKNLKVDFIELHIICEIIHINTNLPKELRGKNIAILANTISIHDKVEWNLSGLEMKSKLEFNAKEGAVGIDGENGKNGGNCTIKCEKIINPSFWTIKSNGSNGLNGQNGIEGCDAKDGIDPVIDDFKIYDPDFLQKNIQKYKKWKENDMDKSIYVQSVDTYLMLVKGTRGKKVINGTAGGRGGAGGRAGRIIIYTSNNQEKNEVKIISSDGKAGEDGKSGQNRKNKFRHGCGAFLYVKGGIKNDIKIEKDFFYEFGSSKIEYENSVFVGNTYYYPKMIHYNHLPNSEYNDVMVVANLISVFRNSFDRLQDVVNKFQLEDFIQKIITYRDLASIIKKSNLMIEHCDELKESAGDYQSEVNHLQDYMRNKISDFLKKIEVSQSSNVLKIRKALIFSSEFSNLHIDVDIDEIEIICDTMHINSDLSDSFRGKNLKIKSEIVFVHDKHTWNLSGSPIPNFHKNGGQDIEGKGNDGQDGSTGNSGGNFYLTCKFIQNFSLLTLISNGSDGANGQDGGNGKNGVNGQNAKDSDFFVDRVELTVPLKEEVFEELQKKENFNLTFKLNYNKEIDYYRGNYISNNGLEGVYYYRKDCCIVLVHGGIGSKGYLGGVGGYGGDGGFGGTIEVETKTESFKMIGNPGIAGKNGQNGHNGIHGRDGGDIYKFHHIRNQSPYIDGIDSIKKFKIIETPYEGSILQLFGDAYKYFLPDINERKIYSSENKSFIEVDKGTGVENVNQQKFRNESTLSRAKSTYTVAIENKLSNLEAFKTEDKSFFNEIENEIFQHEQQPMIVEKAIKQITLLENPSIDMDSIMQEHAFLLKTDFKKLIENELNNEYNITKSESENIMEKIKIPGKRFRSHDSPLKNNPKVIHKKEGNMINSSKLTYDAICSASIKKSPDECIEFLKDAKLNQEQYKYLISNQENLNIVENQSPSTNNEIKDETEDKMKSNISGVIYLCKVKYLTLIYEQIYKTFSHIEKNSNMKPEELFLNSPNFSDQIYFLKDTMNLSSLPEELAMHFCTNTESKWKELYDYFERYSTNLDLPFGESIYNLVSKCPDYNDQFSVVLVDSKSGKKDDILLNFYDKNEINFFIKDELKEKGIQSSIYRKILAHKYECKMVFFRHALNDDIKAFEYHNYGEDLRFEHAGKQFENTVFLKSDSCRKNMTELTEEQPQQKANKSKLSKEIFILFHNNKFSVLDYRSETYENFRYKQFANFNFQQVALILENLHKKVIDAKASFAEDKFQKFLNEIFDKFQISGNIFSSIFRDNSCVDTLCDAVISTFPISYIKLENGNAVLVETDSNNNDENFENNEFFKKDENSIHQVIRKLFKLIAKIDGLPLLNAIFIKFKTNKNFFSLNEFLTFLKSLFIILWKKEDFVTPLTFMILGFDQKFWIPEIIMIKTLRMFGFINRKNEWNKVLHQDHLKKVVWVLLNKLLSLDEDNINDCLTKEEFDDIIKNLEHFDNDTCELLEITNLKSWSLLTTDRYLSYKLENIRKYICIDDEVKTLFEDMNSLYGKKIRKLLEICITKRGDITQIKDDFKEFLRNFTNGRWLLGENILGILEDSKVHNWIRDLNYHFLTDQGTRSAKRFINIIEKDDETSDNIKKFSSTMKTQLQEIKEKIEEFKSLSEEKLSEMSKSTKDTSEGSSSKLLAIIAIIIDRFANVKLRDTQLISILTMHNSQSGVLMQISTGEGKTFIGVAFAIFKVLKGEKVDIVTSSSVLAIRDATSKVNKKIYNFFNIKVGHNCVQKHDLRRKSYENQIVYGTLCNFQRDYLHTEFYEQNIMPDHHFQNIIIDEVDSMLLDKGNNILYLSEDLPDLDEIENIFIFIWQWLNQHFHKNDYLSKVFDTQLIRKVVLDNIYGILSESDIQKMGQNIDSKMIKEKLQQLQIIGEEDEIIKENFYKDYRKIESILGEPHKELADRIVTYCREKIETENHLKIANHLNPFIFDHLNQWIESGKKALFLQNEKEFIIDMSKSTGHENDPNVNIIDLDTGTDMNNSEWDEGLHQFLQIKHGCRVSSLSLKSVFISNVTYIKKYNKKYGMTGTLGNLQEREKIKKVHNIDFVTIPRHVTRNFVEYVSIVKSTQQEWLNSICEEVKTNLDKYRSVLIICKTIHDTKIINKYINRFVLEQNILLYQRDSDKFDIEELEVGIVIISTNLAGRGTDIKLSEELASNGGLHVILTNLPDNARIEEQAFGRAARSGDKGTGRLIICTSINEPVSKLKESRNQKELGRLDEISIYYENFIKIEENFFEKFQEVYKELKANMDPGEVNVFLRNFVIQWSFWLDKNSMLLDDWKNMKSKNTLQKNFKKFLDEKEVLHPMMKIELIKERIGKSNFRHSNQELCRSNKDLLEEDDLIATHYLRLFEMLKINRINGNSKELNEKEIRLIRKCLKMVRESINSRQLKIELIKHLKQKNHENQQNDDGYEKQQKEIIQLYQEISKSLKRLLGEDINPNMLSSEAINNIVMKNMLYKRLLNKNIIKPPQKSADYSEEDAKRICRNNNIEYSKLTKALTFSSQSEIISIKSFEQKIAKNIDLPTRIEFWDILKGKDILKDEIIYAIVDMNSIKNVHPSVGEFIFNSPELLSDITKTEKGKIYFSYVDKYEFENNTKKVIEEEKLKIEFPGKNFEFLLDHDVIEINKKATFDIKHLESIKAQGFLGKFDRIMQKDMKVICNHFQKIIKKLIDLNILTSEQDDTSTYFLVFDNLIKLSDWSILEEDYVYHKSIIELFEQKFAYTIALESLIKDVQNGEESPIIRLEIHPHSHLIHDLFENFIIDQAKVDETKIKDCKNLFNSTGIRDLFDDIDISVDDNFHEKANQRFQTTISFLLENQKVLKNELPKIELSLKNWMKPLKQNDSESKIIVLKPIKDFLPDNKYIHFITLKGLGSIISFQETYT